MEAASRRMGRTGVGAGKGHLRSGVDVDQRDPRKGKDSPGWGA